MKDKGFNRIYAIIPAGGSGSRMGAGKPKQLMRYGTSTVLGTAVEAFTKSGMIDKVIVVSPGDGSLDDIYREELASFGDMVTVIRGGAERMDSVRKGVEYAAGECLRDGLDPRDVLAMMHDAARPGLSEDIIRANIEALGTCEGAVTAVPSVDSVRLIPDSLLKESITYPIMNSNVVERARVYSVQTPQTFRISDMLMAYEVCDSDGYRGTDEASIAEHAGLHPAIVPGSARNSKITYIEDIPMTVRTGTGYDVHRLVPERALILCGTPVPSSKGLLGHSDADVAAHALMDALLGAAGLGDIGRHFPDDDDEYKDADSMVLLSRVRDMLGGATINNVDITIIAQAPKLAPYIGKMEQNIADTLRIPLQAVNVKATTEEGLGFTGRGEGIAAIAVCTIEGRF